VRTECRNSGAFLVTQGIEAMRNAARGRGIHQITRVVAFVTLGVAAGRVTAADSTAATDQGEELQTVTVTPAKVRSLEQFTPTGSRLGLSAQELPATLDVIDNDEMLGRGGLTANLTAVPWFPDLL
jgi:hypothetical protein